MPFSYLRINTQVNSILHFILLCLIIVTPHLYIYLPHQSSVVSLSVPCSPTLPSLLQQKICYIFCYLVIFIYSGYLMYPDENFAPMIQDWCPVVSVHRFLSYFTFFSCRSDVIVN